MSTIDPESEQGTNMSNMFSKQDHPGWCTIESDPALFNSLLCDAGVTNAQVEEIYSLDDQITSDQVDNCFGFIFLFRWKEEEEVEDMESTCPENVWFANQVLDNCCASLAMLNIVFNRKEVELGDHLASFKAFTQEHTPPLRGLAMQHFEYLRKIHNAYAKRAEIMQSNIDILENVENAKKKNVEEEESDENAYHFIAYVPVGGILWELDGLKKQPINLGSCSAGSEDWISMVKPKIRERMLRYSENEVMFTLLAIVRKPTLVVEEHLRRISTYLDALNARLNDLGKVQVNGTSQENGSGNDIQDTKMRQGSDDSALTEIYAQNLNDKIIEELSSIQAEADRNVLLDRRQVLLNEQLQFRKQLGLELEKLETYNNHAKRTKHDYTPFLRRYIELLAQKGVVEDLVRSDGVLV